MTTARPKKTWKTYLKASNNETQLESFYTQFITYNGYKTVLNGLVATVEIAVLGLIIGILIGTLIALVKVMPKYKIMPRILNRVCDVYVGFSAVLLW